MDRQITLLLLGFLIVSQAALHDATFPVDKKAKTEPKSEPAREEKKDLKEEEPLKASATEPKPTAVFPNQLDISSLKNMPLIILHPRSPINFQMLPGENLDTIRKSLNPAKILELIQSAAVNLPSRVPPPNRESLNPAKILELIQSAAVNLPSRVPPPNRESRKKEDDSSKRQPQPSTNRPVTIHSIADFDDEALPRSLLNPGSNNGWLQRFKGSFSNMFPVLKPLGEIPFNFGLPSVHLPVFLPPQGNLPGPIGPFPMESMHQFQSIPWASPNFQNPQFGPQMMAMGDLSAGASHFSPLKMLFPPLNRFRPAPVSPHLFGGDLATSGSAFMPRRIPFGRPFLSRFVSPLQRHKPLFSNVDGLQAASMEISNAFADFTDSKEHGPEVTQKFGSVGHSINTFLKMMGLGGGDLGGFGGGADWAAMDSTPIARSLDFYPGYGNQAHLDDLENLDNLDDLPEFEEDITQKFMDKMNLTNSTSADEKKVTKSGSKKETTATIKIGMEVKDKNKMLSKVKATNVKSGSEGKDITYAPAEPLGKGNDSDSKKQEEPTERPLVRYRIPLLQATVSPKDRKPPIAIYQHFGPASTEKPKPPTYASAQAMPKQEGESNPNKLVDEDVVRQWQLINNGQGYVEKRPVPIVDILKTSMHPESLKVLKKVLSDTGKTNSTSTSN